MPLVISNNVTVGFNFQLEILNMCVKEANKILDKRKPRFSLHDPICVSNISAEEDLKDFTAQWKGLMSPFQDLVLNYTMYTNAHSLTPEICLHLMGKHPETGEDVKSHFEDKQEWATYYAGGQGLSRYLLDYPEAVQNLSVLDVGSGCGAVAIAAAMSGAKKVTASDIDPLAFVAIGLNAEANKVNVSLATYDLIGSEPSEWDCLTVGDMFHDESTVQKLVPWLRKACRQGVHVYIGDPGRPLLRKYLDEFEELALIVTYKISVYHWKEDNEQFSLTKVWRLQCK